MKNLKKDILDACESHDISYLDEILKIYEFTHSNDNYIENLLIYSIRSLNKNNKKKNDKEYFIRKLINLNADINCDSIWGFTPLMYACKNNEKNIVKLLIDSNADVNCQNDCGTTAGMICSLKGNDECLKLILDSNANLDLKNNKAETILYNCIKYNYDYLHYSNDVDENCKIKCLKYILNSYKLETIKISEFLYCIDYCDFMNINSESQLYKTFVLLLKEKLEMKTRFDEMIKKIKQVNRNTIWKKKINRWREIFYLPGGKFEKIGKERMKILSNR